jgi:hypothetical protein
MLSISEPVSGGVASATPFVANPGSLKRHPPLTVIIANSTPQLAAQSEKSRGESGRQSHPHHSRRRNASSYSGSLGKGLTERLNDKI